MSSDSEDQETSAAPTLARKSTRERKQVVRLSGKYLLHLINDDSLRIARSRRCSGESGQIIENNSRVFLYLFIIIIRYFE